MVYLHPQSVLSLSWRNFQREAKPLLLLPQKACLLPVWGSRSWLSRSAQHAQPPQSNQCQPRRLLVPHLGKCSPRAARECDQPRRLHLGLLSSTSQPVMQSRWLPLSSLPVLRRSSSTLRAPTIPSCVPAMEPPSHLVLLLRIETYSLRFDSGERKRKARQDDGSERRVRNRHADTRKQEK